MGTGGGPQRSKYPLPDSLHPTGKAVGLVVEGGPLQGGRQRQPTDSLSIFPGQKAERPTTNRTKTRPIDVPRTARPRLAPGPPCGGSCCGG